MANSTPIADTIAELHAIHEEWPRRTKHLGRAIQLLTWLDANGEQFKAMKAVAGDATANDIKRWKALADAAIKLQGEHPAIKAVLDAFPDAEIEEITPTEHAEAA